MGTRRAVAMKPSAAVLNDTRRFKPYPAYKDSGVEWLGNIPAHWEVSPVYARYEVALGKMLDAKRVTGDSRGCYLRNIDVQWDVVNTNGLPEMDFAPSERERYLLRPGDVLVCEGGEVGRTAIWRGEIAVCFYQKAIHRVRRRAEGESPRFFYYLMKWLAQLGVLVAEGNPNTIDHLTAVQLRHYRLQFAPRSEQLAIAAFLDQETARIDALVAKKERLIELLQEKRAALITRAVTKGLEPNVPMKDSGVEWLGEIPARWEVRRLKHLVKAQKGAIKTGPFGSQLQSSEMRAGEVKVYNQRSVLDRDFSGGENYISLEKFQELAGFETFPGDLLITTRGSIGRCAVLPERAERGILHPCLMRVQPDQSKIFTSFLEIQIEECSIVLEQLRYMSNATTIDVIYSDSLKEAWLVLPPLSQQTAIADFNDRETARIDALVAKLHDAVDRLKELRTALISAAVTGKIDVRGESGTAALR
jgi:type I restriction enzyme S subunit